MVDVRHGGLSRPALVDEGSRSRRHPSSVSAPIRHLHSASLARRLVCRHLPPVELDRHDSQHVFPVGLVLEDLAQLSLGRFECQEEIKCATPG